MRRARSLAGDGIGCAAARSAAGKAGARPLIAIRPARPGDAAAIAAIYAPHVLAGIVSFETEAPDTTAMAGRMAAAGGLYPWIVATSEDGTVLGYAYASRFRDREAYRWTVETTIYMAESAQGAGVGRRLYTVLIDTLTAQGFTEAIGTIALPNAASVRLHEAVDFCRAGLFRAVGCKHDQWIDVGYWQRALAAPGVPPGEPKPFADVGLRRGLT